MKEMLHEKEKGKRMTTIIAGSFQQQTQAQQAMAELHRAGFPADQTTTFFVNPPGQHDRFPIGGDKDESPGTEDAKGNTAAGAAVGGAVGIAVGLATAPLLGPGAAIAGAGVGAYAGSLYGALGKLDDTNEGEPGAPKHPPVAEPPPRQSGVLVAVSAPTQAQQETAIRVLRAQGAADIEKTEGTLVGGEWTDFDPVRPPALIAV
jgi:hypothetical protein